MALISHACAKGKYDAVNFGAKFVPEYIDVVALNDVDTKISNSLDASQYFNSKVALVFTTVSDTKDPQSLFYVILDLIRRRLPITASGELMSIRHSVLKKILPIEPC